MNIIVTGGAGFIGSCFIWKLNQIGEKEIIVIDRAGADKEWGNLQGKLIFDYIDKDLFLNRLKSGQISHQVKAVFHIGACSSTTELNEDYLKTNNFDYARTLAEWSLGNNIPFYYASSAATYGDGSRGYSDADLKIPQLKPLNPYGRSKQLFDLWLLENKLTDKVVGWKFFNVFGPNEYHKGEMRSLVLKGYEQIKASGSLKLFKSYRGDYKDGEQKRDFVYVLDVVDLMANFYLNGQVKGIYNIGSGRAQSWNDLAKALFAAIKLPVSIEYIDMPEVLRDKYQYFTQADLSKLRHTPLPVKIRPLEEAINDYVTNYLANGFARL